MTNSDPVIENEKNLLADPCSQEVEEAKLKLEIPHKQPFVQMITANRSHLSTVIEHVSNIEYIKWLDRAAELHSDYVGYTREKLAGAGMMWFVARHEIDYEAEVWLDDKIMLFTWVKDFQRVKSWREYVMYRPTDDKVVCRATTLWVLVDLESRRPTRLPAEMVEAFKPLKIHK